MNVLSLFDGMSCGRIALKNLGARVDNYFASEVDGKAVANTLFNFPDTVMLGDVRNVRAADLPKIDLLIGGSPCQGFSSVGKRENLQDPRSALFMEYLRILREVKAVNPDCRFLLENVLMDKRSRAFISDAVGVEPVVINSALVSAQSRTRLYWTDIRTKKTGLFLTESDIPLPKDRRVMLKDVLEDDPPTVRPVNLKHVRMIEERIAAGDYVLKHRRWGGGSTDIFPCVADRTFREVKIHPFKTPTLFVREHGFFFLCTLGADGERNYRKLTLGEYKRLQTIPDWYSFNCPESDAVHMIGNGWTVDVVAHILSFLGGRLHE